MTVLEARRAVLPDGHGGLEIVPARVTVEGARIVAVERHPAGPTPAEADDLGDLLLTPAFVDAHTHLALVALRGAVGEATAGHVVEDLYFRVERRLTREDVRVLTAMGALECLLAGTAVVWDHYYFADAVLDGLRDAGIAGIVAPALQDLAGPGVGGAEEALALTRRLAADPVLAAQGYGAALGPHASDTVSDRLWRDVADHAGSLGLPVHVHVAQAHAEVVRAAAVGATPLGRIARTGALEAGPGWLLVHGLYLCDDDLRRLDSGRHTLVACPSSWAHFGFTADVPGWIAAGASWCVASDAPSGNDGLDVRGELRALAALRTGDVATGEAHARWRRTGDPVHADAVAADRAARFAARTVLHDPVALLHRVWTIPGRLHPSLPCGEIRPGALAHLALWDLDHPSLWPADDPLRGLALGACGGALAQVMVAGRWRGRRGDFARSVLEEPRWAELRREATARRRALLASAAG